MEDPMWTMMSNALREPSTHDFSEFVDAPFNVLMMLAARLIPNYDFADKRQRAKDFSAVYQLLEIMGLVNEDPDGNRTSTAGLKSMMANCQPAQPSDEFFSEVADLLIDLGFIHDPEDNEFIQPGDHDRNYRSALFAGCACALLGLNQPQASGESLLCKMAYKEAVLKLSKMCPLPVVFKLIQEASRQTFEWVAMLERFNRAANGHPDMSKETLVADNDACT
jgi:hypothetical protein